MSNRRIIPTLAAAALAGVPLLLGLTVAHTADVLGPGASDARQASSPPSASPPPELDHPPGIGLGVEIAARLEG